MSKEIDDINEVGIRIARTIDALKVDVLMQNNELARTQLKLECATLLLRRSKVWIDDAAKKDKFLTNLQYNIDEFLFKGI